MRGGRDRSEHREREHRGSLRSGRAVQKHLILVHMVRLALVVIEPLDMDLPEVIISSNPIILFRMNGLNATFAAIMKMQRLGFCCLRQAECLMLGYQRLNVPFGEILITCREVDGDLPHYVMNSTLVIK